MQWLSDADNIQWLFDISPVIVIVTLMLMVIVLMFVDDDYGDFK